MGTIWLKARWTHIQHEVFRYCLSGGYYRPYAGYHYLGKRSAEAEPKADAEADPALVFSTPMPTAPTTTDLTDMLTGDKQLTESSQKNYKRKRSTLFVEQLLHYTSEWICHQLVPL